MRYIKLEYEGSYDSSTNSGSFPYIRILILKDREGLVTSNTLPTETLGTVNTSRFHVYEDFTVPINSSFTQASTDASPGIVRITKTFKIMKSATYAGGSFQGYKDCPQLCIGNLDKNNGLLGNCRITVTYNDL